MNEVVEMHFKSFMTNFFTVVGLLVEISTSIAKPKGYFEAYPYTSQPPITVTSKSPSFILRYLFFGIIMRTNSRFIQV